MRRNLKIFFLFSKFSLKTTFQGRFGVVLFMVGKILRFLFLFFLIFIVFSKTKLIKGYNLNQVIIFYLTFNVIDTASQVLFREVYRFRPMVVSGNFDLVLSKPYHPFLRILVGGIDFMDLLLLVPYFILSMILVMGNKGVTIGSVFVYFAFIINSLLIATAFHISVLALAIMTTEIDHTILIYRDITSLGRFPIDIYKEPVRSIFTFVIPIGIMMSIPVKVLFNLVTLPYMFISVSVAGLLFFLSMYLWNFALKKYQSWGG